MSRHTKKLKQMQIFYKPIFREWRKLYEAFLEPIRHCAISNKYFTCANELIHSLKLDIKEFTLDSRSPLDSSPLREPAPIKCKEVEETFGTSWTPRTCGDDAKSKGKALLNIFTGSQFPPPKRFIQKKGDIFPYYLMDMSSLLPVMALDVQPNDRVLDMCSAPGGKAVAISQFLSHEGQVVCNELSRSRLKKLEKVIDEYIPKILQRTGVVTITNWNGTLFGEEEGCSFDKVLVDAQCSSERHVIQNEFQDSGWNLRQMKQNQKLQINLLRSGLKSVKPGGVVVYSTCSISPWENEDVVKAVRHLLKKDGIKVQCSDKESTMAHTVNRFGSEEFYIHKGVTNGILILPTEFSNWGPLYFAKLTRLK